MRYESMPRKIGNALRGIYKTIKFEFGPWTIVVIGFIAFLLYKPIKRLLDPVTQYIAYGFGAFAVLFGLYFLFGVVLRRRH